MSCPAVPSRRQARIPSVWDQGDVARILDAVDRGNPCGKRDYAIILLVAGSQHACSVNPVATGSPASLRIS